MVATMERPMYRMLVADDHPMFRAAMTMAIRVIDPGARIVEAATMREVEAMVRQDRFDLILLDLHLPDGDGLEALMVARRAQPGIPTVVISADDDLAVIERVAQAGAVAFLPKSMAIDQMTAALRTVLSGGRSFPPALGDVRSTAGADPAIARLSRLSPAQLSVLRAAAGGQSNKVLAHLLGLTEPTIKTHLTATYRKLGVTNRTQAVLLYQSATELPA